MISNQDYPIETVTGTASRAYVRFVAITKVDGMVPVMELLERSMYLSKRTHAHTSTRRLENQRTTETQAVSSVPTYSKFVSLNWMGSVPESALPLRSMCTVEYV